MLFDLNVPWPVNNYSSKPTASQLKNLTNTIVTLYSLGYSHIAINFVMTENTRIPVNKPEDINPINIEGIRKRLERFQNLKLYTRITMMISDPSQYQGLNKISNAFDILAVQPLTETSLQLAISNLDIDLICFNLSSKLPFFLKHKTVGSGVSKGIKFEICYSPVVSGPAGYSLQSANENMNLSTSAALARRIFFSNVLQLVRASRSKGLVVSSGATQPLQARNSNDILTLLKTMGLDSSRAKSCMSENAEKALLSGRLRSTSYKQTVVIGNDNGKDDVLYNNEYEDANNKTDIKSYKKRLSNTSSGRLLKKQKLH